MNNLVVSSEHYPAGPGRPPTRKGRRNLGIYRNIADYHIKGRQPRREGMLRPLSRGILRMMPDG